MTTIENSQATVRVGIIGAGMRGIKAFGKSLHEHPQVQLSALADPNLLRMQNANELLDEKAALYTDVSAMLHESQLDGVIVTTPDYNHAQTVIAALHAGVKHVLVDKPLATTTQDCMAVVQAIEETGGNVTIGFNMRHAPLFSRIKEVIANGEIGELMMGENREFYNGGRTYMGRWNRHYAKSGGLFVHKGTHDFDVFNWWNEGGTPTRVFAFAGLNALRADKIPFKVEEGKPVGPTCSQCDYSDICPDRSDIGKTLLFNDAVSQSDGYHNDLCIYTSDKDVHDNGIALVEYDNNVRFSHMECFVCNFKDRLYTLVGDRGTLVAHRHGDVKLVLKPRWGEDKIIDLPKPRQGSHEGSDPALVDDFVAIIQGKNPPKTATIKDGVSSVAVGQAAEISWREGRMVNISELVDLHDPRLTGDR